MAKLDTITSDVVLWVGNSITGANFSTKKKLKNKGDAYVFVFLAQGGDAGKLWFQTFFQVTSVMFPICMFSLCVSPWCETD